MKNPRRVHRAPRGGKAGREREDIAKELAISEAEREGVEGAIREPGDRDAIGIDSIHIEDPGQSAVDELDIRFVAAAASHVAPRASGATKWVACLSAQSRAVGSTSD